METWIPLYPSRDDPDIYQKLNAKWEFRELATEPHEDSPGHNQPFKHQEAFLRYMQHYDTIFNIQETGTGKSRSTILLAEYYKNNPREIRRILVLEHGGRPQADFKRQVVSSSGGDYVKKKNFDEEKVSQRMITMQVKKWYQTDTYRKFAGTLKKMDDQQIIQQYSGMIFFFDEIQNLRSVMKKGKPKSQLETSTYDQILRLTRLVKRSKFILASATPMINEIYELPYVVNLMLPAHAAMPLDTKFMDDLTFPQLSSYLQCKVTYVRTMDIGITSIEMGDLIDMGDEPHQVSFPRDDGTIEVKMIPSQLKLVNLRMSSFQNKAYQTVKDDTNDVYYRPKTASVFVYPNGNFGTTDTQEYFEKDKEKGPTDDLLTYLKEDKNVKKSSIKFYFVLKQELALKGCAYIYFDLVEKAGIKLLARCFQLRGFEEYAFTSSAMANGKPTIEKKLRYGLIVGSASESQTRSLLEMFNSPDNVDGEYIKIVFVSSTGREGINIFNCLRIYMMMGFWNLSGEHQAIYRAIRSNSHINLIKVYTERGEPIPEIEIYRLSAHAPGDVTDSVDRKIILEAELKQIKISRVMRMLKMCAFDRGIHRKRNIRPGDVDYSAVCDYDVCNYVETSSTKIDYSTYKILYAEPLINLIAELITEILVKEGSLTRTQLLELMPDRLPKMHMRYNSAAPQRGDLQLPLSRYIIPKKIPEDFILMAITQLIDRKVMVRNHFGLQSYVQSNGPYIFIQSQFPVSTGLSRFAIPLTYQRNLYAELPTSLDHLIEERPVEYDLPAVTDTAQLWERLKITTKQNRSRALEQIFLDRMSEQKDEDVNVIHERLWDLYQGYFYQIDGVWYHTLLMQINETDHAVIPHHVKPSGDYRRLNANNTWVTFPQKGNPQYKPIQTTIHDINIDKFLKYRHSLIFGIQLGPSGSKDTRVVIVKSADAVDIRRLEETDQRRSINWGSQCTSIPAPDLASILTELTVRGDLPYTGDVRAADVSTMQKELAQGDMFNVDPDRLEIMYKWTKEIKSKRRVCDLLHTFLNQHELMMKDWEAPMWRKSLSIGECRS